MRAAIPSAEAYYSDDNSYVGMDFAALKAIDSAVAGTLTVSNPTDASYCLHPTTIAACSQCSPSCARDWSDLRSDLN